MPVRKTLWQIPTIWSEFKDWLRVVNQSLLCSDVECKYFSPQPQSLKIADVANEENCFFREILNYQNQLPLTDVTSLPAKGTHFDGNLHV